MNFPFIHTCGKKLIFAFVITLFDTYVMEEIVFLFNKPEPMVSRHPRTTMSE